MASIDGLISGLNTTTIISQLMAIERLPEQQLTKAQTASQTMVSTLQSLNTLITSLGTAAKSFVPDSITNQSAWTSTTATSSNSALASALTGAGALPGSSSFTVTSVATAGSAVSNGTVASLTAPVAGGPFMVSKGAAPLGLSALGAGASLAPGTHTVEVTQSSAGATVSGSPVAGFAATPPAVTIDGTNNTISFYRDGSSTPSTITLNQGTYSPAQLAAEIGRASGGAISSSTDPAGRLQLSTAREGSSTSLQLAATNATLGLLDTTTVTTGVDAIIKLDGVATTVSSVGAGDQLTLGGVGTDSVVATLAGGLRKGVATTNVVTVAAGATLTDVVRALNGPGTGVSATAVQVGVGAYRLQVTSTTTGSASDVTLGNGVFPAGQSSLGDMQQLSAGTDTVLRVGTGPGAFDVTSSTTSVSGLLPGVTITALKADPSTTVTVNVASDTSGMADQMASMVAQANAVLSFVDAKSSYDATSKTGGPMVGDSMGRDLTTRLTAAVIGSSSSTPAMSGVSVARDGSISFDRAVFLAALAKDPATVTATMTSMSQQLSDVATQASDPHTGYVTARVTGEQDSIRGYTKQIAAFEDRMTLRQQTLQTQYAALETMLGKLKSQSDWLTGQLATLTTSSSSK
jgi:flagellar hook-associated protein 2